MTRKLNLEGRTAAITGAGNGIGRAYALELARRGVKVVVNDLGGSATGDGADATVAEAVVAEIARNGGEAAAHSGSVALAADMQEMVDLAIDRWGKLDILINNAGSVGGVGISDSTEAWNQTLSVNLHGVVNSLRAAWPHFESCGYGRVVNTTSSSFLGTPGAGAYAAAKGGVLGITNVLSSTYPDVDIKVNAVMPIAGTRMTAMVPDPVYRDWLQNHFQPEKVAAFIPVLCDESLQVSGETFTVGGGRAARVLFETTDGHFTPEPTAEDFFEQFDTVMAGNGPRYASSGQGDLARYADLLGDPGPF